MSRRPSFRILIPACLACYTQVAIAQDLPQVSAPSTSNTNSESAITLDSVQVRDERKPYRDISATGAIKTDALIKDLPMSIRVISSDLLQDAGVTDLAGALDLASGINRQSNLGGLWNSYSMRGFTGDPNYGSDYMVNGFNSSRGYNGLRDGANTETVEILKGPASALYGRGEPGGSVNITTKKPFFTPRNVIAVSYGRYNTMRATVDSTGPLSDQVAYRINGAYEEGESFRDEVSQDSYLLAPSFLWMPSMDTTVSYEAEATRRRATFDRGVVAVDGILGTVPISRFLGEPADGNSTVESLGHQLFVQHFFNDNWSLQTGVTYRKSSLAGLATEPWSLLEDKRTLRRFIRSRDLEANDTSGRFELLGKIGGGSVVHNVLFGVDGYKFEDVRDMRRGRSASVPYEIDIHDPVYGVSIPPSPLAQVTDSREIQRSFGFYAQDQIEFGSQWKALIGVRYDSFTQTVNDHRTNIKIAQDSSRVSPRAGLVYQPNNIASIYATVSKGFRPNSGVTMSGDSFDAEVSISNEVGLKLDSANGRYSGTLAAFKINKENVLTNDPQDINYSIAVGEIESKGFELDVSGELFKGLRLSAAYAYTDVSVVKSTEAANATGLAQGRRMPNVPRNSGNVFAVYNHELDRGRSYSIGGGVFYVDDRLGSVDQNVDFVLPKYTTVRLVSAYNPSKNLRLSFDIDNLLNKEYYAYSYSSLWVYPGAPRTYKIGLQYTF